MKNHVYILQSHNSLQYYIGSTSNIDQRLNCRNTSQVKSTRNKGLWKIVFMQEYQAFKVARQVENRLKKLKRRDYIEKIIEDGYIK